MPVRGDSLPKDGATLTCLGLVSWLSGTVEKGWRSNMPRRGEYENPHGELVQVEGILGAAELKSRGKSQWHIGWFCLRAAGETFRANGVRGGWLKGGRLPMLPGRRREGMPASL